MPLESMPSVSPVEVVTSTYPPAIFTRGVEDLSPVQALIPSSVAYINVLPSLMFIVMASSPSTQVTILIYPPLTSSFLSA